VFITKMKLSRRTVLRGLGVSIALPFLDSMVPALTATAQTSANAPRRFGAVFVPHGERPGYWTPPTVGTNFEMTPILKPLEPFRESMTIVSELCLPLNGHATTVSAWLSGAIPKQTFAEDVRSAITIDQVIAKRIGQDTPLPSLEVATENVEGFIGGCDALYSCAYMNTIAWKSETSPMPMEINPRMLFERMFGAPGTAEQRNVRLLDNKSILDSAADDIGQLERKRLGTKDRRRLTEYLDNIREIEQRIQRAEAHSTKNVVVPDAPIGIPESWQEHALLMYDLIALAYASDTTRVFTFMKARDASNRVYTEAGITEPHHALSHHGGEKEKIANLVKLNTYHVNLFGKFVQKLRDTPDGDGSLLDHSIILYGSGMSESNNHSRLDVPTLLVGGGGGLLKGNRHIKAPKETPNGNLLLDLAGKFGCDVDKFGVSSGRFEV
jgi:hypothetical protein